VAIVHFDGGRGAGLGWRLEKLEEGE